MERIDRGETVASRQRCDFRAMDVREGIWHHDKATIRLTGQRSNDGFEFGCVANRGRDRLYSEGRRSGFEGVQEIFGISCCYRIEQEGDSGDTRRNLLEQFQPFAGHRRLDTCEAGDVAAWSRKAGAETANARVDKQR